MPGDPRAPSDPASRAVAITPLQAALVLGLLLGLQPVVTDMFLPALPAIQRELAAPMSLTQLTMSGAILAFGLGQLVWGPVSDRFGRRPVLLASLALLVLMSLGSSLSTSMTTLVGWRIAQGASLAAVIMAARAIVRDLYEPTQGTLVMTNALTVLGVFAIATPSLGGALASWGGWRATLVGVAIMMAVGGFVVWRWLPETLRQRNPDALKLGPYARQLRDVAAHRTFRAFALLVAATYGGLFTFLASSSFVYIDVLGLSPAAYGVVMASVSLAYLLGTLHCRRLIRARGVPAAVKRGAIYSVIASITFALAGWVDARAVWPLLLPQYAFAFAHGIHQPCGQAGVVSPFPRAAGVASSLAGFTMAAVAVLSGLWLGHAMDGTTRPLAYTVAGWSIATALVALTLVQRHGSEQLLAQRAARA